MTLDLRYRKATQDDLKAIITLLTDDDLGKTRESTKNDSMERYINAFKQINGDENHYLMVVEHKNEVIGVCHLTLMPSLTFKGSLRMNIEGVRVRQDYRAQGIGEKMMQEAVEYARKTGVSIIQLTTNKSRDKAKRFYEKLGFQATHEGMKMPLD